MLCCVWSYYTHAHSLADVLIHMYHVTCHAHLNLGYHGVAECPTLVWWISAPPSDSSVAISDCLSLPRAQEMCSYP